MVSVVPIWFACEIILVVSVCFIPDSIQNQNMLQV